MSVCWSGLLVNRSVYHNFFQRRQGNYNSGAFVYQAVISSVPSVSAYFDFYTWFATIHMSYLPWYHLNKDAMVFFADFSHNPVGEMQPIAIVNISEYCQECIIITIDYLMCRVSLLLKTIFFRRSS